MTMDIEYADIDDIPDTIDIQPYTCIPHRKYKWDPTGIPVESTGIPLKKWDPSEISFSTGIPVL
jgi:hypothetical protein